MYIVLHILSPFSGVSLGTTTPAEWSEMGAAIVAGIESGWVNPVINQVRLEFIDPHTEMSVLIRIAK